MHFLDILLHIDVHLRSFVIEYGLLVYVILFVLVATPFVSGDALLFAGGTLAGMGMLDYPILCAVLLCSTIIGDSVIFYIGKYAGPSIFQNDHRWIKRQHLDQAHAFYEKHGGKAILLARFMPVIRIFAPFAAGVAGMSQGRYFFFNALGALLWVGGLVTIGFFLGGLPIMQKDFSLLVYIIALVAVFPLLLEGGKRILLTLRAHRAG